MREPSGREHSEMSILGAMLLDNKVLDVLTMLPATTRNAFLGTGHGKIYDAIVTLHGRKRAVDLVTLRDELERRGELEAVGGVEYLASLLDHAPGINK